VKTNLGDRRGLYSVFVGNPEEKRPPATPRRRREDNIKMDLQEVGCAGHGLDRSGLGYGQVAGTCECGNVPSGSIKCGQFPDLTENRLASKEGLCSVEYVSRQASTFVKTNCSVYITPQ
jgi:hypothetical protein